MNINNKKLLAAVYIALTSSCSNIANLPAKSVKTDTQDISIDKSQLDVLSDYDKDLWVGPEGWSIEQWQWKATLKWDQHCDYVGTVNTYDLTHKIQLIAVECVPGAYQPMQYLYLYDTESRKNQQLLLGGSESTDNPKEIWGSVAVNSAAKEVAIVSLSRGLGDCGIYRLFTIAPAITFEQTRLTAIETRKQACTDRASNNINALPPSVFDYKQWPIQLMD